MNGTEPKIEIFKPFGEAFELTKKILFQPFNLSKWCVIGFAAFLAGGVNFNFGFKFPFNGAGNWSFRSSSYNSSNVPLFASGEHIQAWVVALIAVISLIVLATIVVLSWVRARGAFIFTDCIVRNRPAIVEPWKEFWREGNSLFLFSWLVVLLFLAAAAAAFAIFLLPIIISGKSVAGKDVGMIVEIVLFCALIVFAALGWALISHFMVPIMYRRRCRAVVAFREATSLVTVHPAPIIFYCLFLIVLAIACGIIGCVTTCVTCCIAAIPYVGTVILLPIFVLLRSFLLCFLRQFGSDYDVWVGIPQPEPGPIPPSIPPSLPT
ncbi:MAG TPA: hypothetical protein VNY07_11165 [Chthoniobacterales bacterium]|jgi:hypothetical protein|nr:hypothetical protein [Chthoniobacterales bacterium]